MKTLLIDNYDSYTFNLYQLLALVNGEAPLVVRNDLDWDRVKEFDFQNIVISPGPGRPELERDFGLCRQALLESQVPVLGVCLGHQGIGYLAGGTIVHAPVPMHGRLSSIYHSSSDLFEGIPQGFAAMRYHSLLVSNELPKHLETIAWTEDNLIMGLRHRQRLWWGVQFHPESIATEYGQQLLENFKAITANLGFQHKIVAPPTGKTVSAPASKEQRSPQGDFLVCSRKLDCYPDAERAFFHLFGNASYAFWLDSARIEPGLSRFSFMGDSLGEHSLRVEYRVSDRQLAISKSGKVTRSHLNIFEYLERELARRYWQSEELPFDFNCGFVGYFGYELKAECGASLVHRSSLPDAAWILSDRLIAFDHLERVTYLVYLAKVDQTAAELWFLETEKKLHNLPPLPATEPRKSNEAIAFRLRRPYSSYLRDIQTCQREIANGETYEVCLTNSVKTEVTPDPLAFYRILRRDNPAPYSAFLRWGNFAIACSSPERFLRLDRQGWVESKPIKGTVTRGKTPEDDRSLKQRLQAGEKDRAENLMIVDLLRNDLGSVCEIGSIRVPKLMDVETYSTVHQLVSTIRGQLRSDVSICDCIRRAFPGGSMTGAPKLRTMEIIDRLEGEARGIYSGTIGFLGLNGTADLNIVIRTAIVTPQATTIGIGGAIVALSDPQEEFEETILKARALMEALALTLGGKIDENWYRHLATASLG